MAKVILITGASSGIGKDTALRLIQEGHRVYGAARRIDRMQDIVTAGGKAIKMDVTIESEIEAAVSQVIEEQGRIDVLFNNAGYGLFGAVELITIEEARRQFDVNIFGLARMTKKVIPLMRKQGSGTIINMSSVGGKVYSPFGAWYHGTKHALEGWSDCLRLELKPFNIDVVLIEPGAIATEFGSLMYDGMVERSQGTPYERPTKIMAGETEKIFSADGKLSPPSVISNLVVKAVRAKKPRIRYVAGKYSSSMLFARKYFSDRFFDKLYSMLIYRKK